MKCDWCGRKFNAKATDGVCPSCGGFHEVAEQEGQSAKTAPKTATVGVNTTVTSGNSKTVVKLVLIGVILSVSYMLFSSMFRLSYDLPSETVDIPEPSPAIARDIPLKFSHIVPTKAVMEGDTVVGLPDGSSGAVTIIPDGAKHIADYAFADEPIMAVIFPDTLESIGDYAFYDCYDLEYAKLPDSLKTVGDYAFTYTGDDLVVDFGDVPTTLESVGDYAFSVFKVHGLPEGVKVGEGSFDYSEYSVGLNEDGMLIMGDVLVKYAGTAKNVTIPDGVLLIDAYAFRDNEAIETLVMPDSVTEIGDSAFFGANSLQTVVFSPNITTMGDAVFEDCGSLQGAELPEGLLHIGDDGFVGCDEMHELHIPSTLITASRDSFDGCAWYYDNYIGGLEQWIFGDGILASLYTTYEADVQHFPEGIKRIGHNALFLTYDREEIIFPEGVEVIHDGAISAMGFIDGDMILDIPDSVVEIQGRPVHGGISSDLEVIFRCSQGSYAFEYAQEHGYEIIPR